MQVTARRPSCLEADLLSWVLQQKELEGDGSSRIYRRIHLSTVYEYSPAIHKLYTGPIPRGEFFCFGAATYTRSAGENRASCPQRFAGR